jgi:hypothetical protein
MVKCPFCTESFKNANGVVRHAKKQHPPRFPRLWQDEFADKVIRILRDPRLFDLEKFKKISELKEAKDDENIKVFLGLRDALQSPKSAKSI